MTMTRSSADSRSSAAPLTVKNLTVAFDEFRALDDLSLDIPAGSCVGLIGPNGAGKSTLFRAILGLVPVASGTIEMDGRPITGLPTVRRVHRGIATTLQSGGVFLGLTVRESLVLAARRARRKWNLAEAIETHHLSDVADVPVSELSHGYQQRLELAMAEVASPRLLLLDEPVAGMSAVETQAMVESIQAVNQAGPTVVFIDHDLAFVRALAQEIAVMHQGRMIARGTPDEISEDPEVMSIYFGTAGGDATGHASEPDTPDKRTTR
jgi:ABC-type branched-subunit amino acid transport system ATPase component